MVSLLNKAEFDLINYASKNQMLIDIRCLYSVCVCVLPRKSVYLFEWVAVETELSY